MIPARLFLIPHFSFIILLFTGCLSLVEKAGQALDGSAFAEKKTAVYTASGMELWEMNSKSGGRSFIINLVNYPTIKLRCSSPNEQGEFNLVSLDYLGGSAQGWNEFRLELAGEGKLVLDGTTASISVHHDSVEPIQINFARIKRYDTRLSGTEALTMLRNRYERIKAIAEWMRGQDNDPKEMYVHYFEQYWKSILFPELVSKKKRPADWQQENDQWSRAESINWNTSYTERMFPEELREIRNSGTMLRDWEEALDWLYNEYEWNRIKETLAKETVLTKKK
jgi:hypothetical protein